STGEFVLETLEQDGLEEALSRLDPAEIVTVGDTSPLPIHPQAGTHPASPPLTTRREPCEFYPDLARAELPRRFGLSSLDALGVGPRDVCAIGGAGALHRNISALPLSGLHRHS